MKRILIAEDHADIRKLIRMTLEYTGHQIHETVNGVSALHMAKALKPDLMLLDVMMPGRLDGLQVCQQVKADPELTGTRIIMLTARGQLKDQDAGSAAGADAYLVKPFSPLHLIDTIEHWLGST